MQLKLVVIGVLVCCYLAILYSPIHAAEQDSIPTIAISKTNSNYLDFVIVKNKVVAINSDHQLVVWDLNQLDTVYLTNQIRSLQCTAICKSKQNDVYIATTNGGVFKIDPSTLNCELVLNCQSPITAICINSRNKIFLVTKGGVYNPLSGKKWTKFRNHTKGIIYHKSILGIYTKRSDCYFSKPQFTYLDSQDRWWLCSSYGEFGGDIEIFDTRHQRIYNNKFDSLSAGAYNPKSIFEDDKGTIYLTSGLQHMHSSGQIYRIATKNKATKIFSSRDFKDTSVDVRMMPIGIIEIIANLDQELFVGPGTYNSKDSSIYFATDAGFYKAHLPITGKIKTIIPLFEPELNCCCEPLAVGKSMAVLKVEWNANQTLFFLTALNGIGFYDGKKITFLK